MVSWHSVYLRSSWQGVGVLDTIFHFLFLWFIESSTFRQMDIIYFKIIMTRKQVFLTQYFFPYCHSSLKVLLSDKSSLYDKEASILDMMCIFYLCSSLRALLSGKLQTIVANFNIILTVKPVSSNDVFSILLFLWSNGRLLSDKQTSLILISLWQGSKHVWHSDSFCLFNNVTCQES